MHDQDFESKISRIRKAIDVLFAPGDVVEIRCLGTKWKTLVGYYNDHAKMASDLAGLSYKVEPSIPAAYYCLNPVPEVCLNRSFNDYQQWAQHSVTDADIPRLRRLLIDFDANKPLPDVMAKTAEREAAQVVMYEAHEFLGKLGWPEPLPFTVAVVALLR